MLTNKQMIRETLKSSTKSALLDTIVDMETRLSSTINENDKLSDERDQLQAKVIGLEKLQAHYHRTIDDKDWEIKRLKQRLEGLLYAIILMQGEAVKIQEVIRKTKVDNTNDVTGMVKLLDTVKLAI